jgi:hypothetical protein
MYTRLAAETLKSGERMEVGVVLGPDADWLPRIAPFLGHKGPDYSAHIRRALEGPLDGLETRFYVGSVDGRIVSQVMIVGARGAGILGHVFTCPEERRKGACALIMRHQMDDCRRAGFQALCLGTGFETPPYWIYHSHGFRGVAAGTGRMKWLAEPDAEERLFREAAVSVRDLRWDDWGYFDLLAYQPVLPDEELPRCPTLGARAQDSVEGPFVTYQLRRERELQVQAKVLVSAAGATAGWALLSPDTHWFRDVWLLDLHAHPRFTRHLPDLVGSLELPAAPVAAYLTRPEGPRAAALSGLGFRRTAVLPRWLAHDGRRDLAVWLRE